MRKRKAWGDPWSYSDVESARIALRKPNGVICVRCRAQAKRERDLVHETGCPAAPRSDP